MLPNICRIITAKLGQLYLENNSLMFLQKLNPLVIHSHVLSTNFSGGVPITVTGKSVDSVAEPIMVVTVITSTEVSVYYQVHFKI